MAKSSTAAALAEVRARRAAIAAEMADILAKLQNPEIQALQAEDKLMATTEQGLERLSRRIAKQQPSRMAEFAALATERREKPRKGKRKRRTNSAEAHILAVLKEASQVWWTAAEIKAAVDLRTGKNVKMTTISPALSAMRNKEVLQRDGLKVALKEMLTFTDEPAEPVVPG